MNLVFFGSSHFAIPSLKSLKEAGFNISCVITQPDKAKGRGLLVSPTEVKTLAQDLGLKVFQPKLINAPSSIEYLKALQPDLFVIISYGQILVEEVIAIPSLMTINVHASLLPKYRGASPINLSIINGDRYTGASVIKLVRKMDAGPLILQKTIAIDDTDTNITLEDKLSNLSGSLLIEGIESIKNKAYNLESQDESSVSYAYKLKKEFGLIDWEKSAVDIHNHVRGCLNWPSSFTYYQGKLVKILKTKLIQYNEDFTVAKPGKIVGVSKNGIVVACGLGGLNIDELQMEGSRKLRIDEFITGHRISVDDEFSRK